MSRAWLISSLLAACSTVPNPLYCDENAPCKNGQICNLDTHGCEASIDAAPVDELVIDAPFVARTIQEVRAASTPDDTPVELEDVVVVAIDRYGVRVGEVWVQEEGGGPDSGIRIFGGVASEVAALSVGDVIDVTEVRKFSYAPLNDTSGRHEIEVAPFMGGILHIMKKSRTATPVVATIDVAAIAVLPAAQRDAERDKLVGMLVRVSNVAATSNLRMVAVIPDDPTVYAFSLPAIEVQSTMAAFPNGIQQGHCFSSITGLVEYRNDYHLLPTTTANINDTSCL